VPAQMLRKTVLVWITLGVALVSGGCALQAQTSMDGVDGLRSGALFDELARMDAILFDASFASCDAAKANAIFADDVEFYHDEAGFSAGEQVRENTRQLTASCPAARGVTRTVVPGSLKVYPIESYGAVQVGVHRFDERGAATSTLARFVHLWKFQNGQWRLARVLSLDHHAVDARHSHDAADR
jgi:FAD/FMN-containing dehydrogenase